MRIDPPSPSSWIQRALIFFLILFACLGIYIFLSRPQAAPRYEITNFFGNAEIYSLEEKKWIPARRGVEVLPGTKIRTGGQAELNLRISEIVTLRMKEHSELILTEPSGIFAADKLTLHLLKGTLLGATGKKFEKGRVLEITTPVSVAAVRGTLFRIVHEPESKRTWAGVLQGDMRVSTRQGMGKKTLRLSNLEAVEIVGSKAPSKAQPMTQTDWVEIKEAYELIEREVGFETIQQDLAKEAGNLFQYVFDHGTFFMPRVGFAEREFMKDELTQKVIMNVRYDVFPVGSFVGVYLKTRGVDLAGFEALRFHVRRMPGEGYPDAFRIEIKSKGQVIRGFAPKVFKKDWQEFEFKFTANQPADVTEITFVFTHQMAGEHKTGALQFRKIELIPKVMSNEEPAKEAEEAIPPA